jgi:hypothetical protein
MDNDSKNKKGCIPPHWDVHSIKGSHKNIIPNETPTRKQTAKNKNILVCKKISFYSLKDEDIFFWWVQTISCIEYFDGVGDELYLYIINEKISNENLEDLIALFYRYKIKKMNQLKIFLNNKNKEWFYDNKKAFWHKRVFEE